MYRKLILLLLAANLSVIFAQQMDANEDDWTPLEIKEMVQRLEKYRHRRLLPDVLAEVGKTITLLKQVESAQKHVEENKMKLSEIDEIQAEALMAVKARRWATWKAENSARIQELILPEAITSMDELDLQIKKILNQYRNIN